MNNGNKSGYTDTVTINSDLVVQSLYTLIIAIVAFLVVFEIYFKFSLIRKILRVIFSVCRELFRLFGIAKVTAIHINENNDALSANGEVVKSSISADDYSSNSGSSSGSGDNRVEGTGIMKSVKINSPNSPSEKNKK
jgi:hypothetical protein